MLNFANGHCASLFFRRSHYWEMAGLLHLAFLLVPLLAGAWACLTMGLLVSFLQHGEQDGSVHPFTIC